jgi:zeaxanthin glucosyltransferase
MLAMPFVSDQMGVASRIVFRGVGLSRPATANSHTLGIALAQLLKDGNYRDRSLEISKAMRSAEGAARAAEIIECAAVTKRPVLNARLSPASLRGNGEEAR